MAETQVLERTADATVVKVGGNGQQVSIPTSLPILPIRNVVVFPGTVMPLNVGRAKSKSLLEEVMPGEYRVAAAAAPATVAALTAWLAEQDLPLADLRAGRQTLEDVFLRLTGPAS